MIAAPSAANEEIPSLSGSKMPIGRPRSADSERALKPWIAAGISERTYHRRKAVPPTPHDAHVVSWKALTSFERLDIIVDARRMKIAAARRKPFGEEIEIALRKRAH